MTLDAPASVEEIDLDNSGGGSYTIAGTSTLTLALSSTNAAASECLINVSGGSHAISAPLALAAPGNLVNVTNPTDSLTLNGSVSGVGGLTKTGSGTLLLLSANTYAGATTLSGGWLRIGNAFSLQDSTVVLSGGSLDLGGYNATLGGLSGGGNLVIGSGTLTVGNNNTGTTIYSGSLGGAGALAKTGPGELVLAGSNAYAGGTSVSAGALVVTTTAALPGYASAGSVSVAAGATLGVRVGGAGEWGQGNINALVNNANFAPGAMFGIDTTDAAAAYSYSNNVAGNIGFDKLGSGMLILNGTNTYTGGTTVSAGALVVTTTAALPGYASAGSVSAAAGAMLGIRVGGAGEWSQSNISAMMNNASFAPGALLGIDTTDATAAYSYSNNVAGNIGLTKLGANTLLLSGSNTYTGPTTIAAGTLQIGNAAALQNSTVALGGGSLDLNGFSPTLGGLSGSGSLAIAAGTLAVGNNGANTTYSGNLSGGGAFAKIGGGALILAGVNAYAGPTTVAAGTLQIGNGGGGAASRQPKRRQQRRALLRPFRRADLFRRNRRRNRRQRRLGALLLGGAVSAAAVNVNGGTLQLSANNQLADNPIVSVSPGGVFEAAGHNQTLGGLIMSGGVVDSGSGTLTLAGSLQYQQSNYTAMIDGKLSLGGSTLTVDVTSGAAWDLIVYASISGSAGAGIVKTANTGMLTLGGENTYPGPTIVNGGYLQIGDGGSGESLASTGISLNNASSLMFDQLDTFAYSGSITGNGSVQQLGPGTVVLAGSNTYTGSTAISPGTLQIGNGGGGESFASPSVSNSGALVFNQSDTFLYAGSISGTGSLIKLGPGTAVLSGSNTYTGPTIISAGTLQIGNGGGGETYQRQRQQQRRPRSQSVGHVHLRRLDQRERQPEQARPGDGGVVGHEHVHRTDDHQRRLHCNSRRLRHGRRRRRPTSA